MRALALANGSASSAYGLAIEIGEHGWALREVVYVEGDRHVSAKAEKEFSSIAAIEAVQLEDLVDDRRRGEPYCRQLASGALEERG